MWLYHCFGLVWFASSEKCSPPPLTFGHQYLESELSSLIFIYISLLAVLSLSCNFEFLIFLAVCRLFNNLCIQKLLVIIGIWNPSVPTRDQTRSPLHWEHWFLATEPPGKSLESELLPRNSWLVSLWTPPHWSTFSLPLFLWPRCRGNWNIQREEINPSWRQVDFFNS